MTTNNQQKSVYDSLQQQQQINVHQIYEEKHYQPVIRLKSIEFIAPQELDYIDCERNDHEVTNCHVVKRILHILKYYQEHKNVQMFEYITSLDNYSVPTFMEDWYQAKKNHFANMNDTTWTNNIDIKC
eukprot:449444_1